MRKIVVDIVEHGVQTFMPDVGVVDAEVHQYFADDRHEQRISRQCGGRYVAGILLQLIGQHHGRSAVFERMLHGQHGKIAVGSQDRRLFFAYYGKIVRNDKVVEVQSAVGWSGAVVLYSLRKKENVVLFQVVRLEMAQKNLAFVDDHEFAKLHSPAFMYMPCVEGNAGIVVY